MSNIKLILGDCVQELKKIPDNSVDLVVTSPPYNCGIRYTNWNDRMRWDKYYAWCEAWLQELYRVSKDDGRICLVHYFSLGSGAHGYDVGVKNGTSQDDDYTSRHAPLMQLNCIAEGLGFKHHSVAIWWDTTITKKTAWGSWLSASAPYINAPFEGVLILYKKDWKKSKPGKTDISKKEFIEGCHGVWKIATEHDRTHPAPFPVKLADRCIKLFSYEQDVVLDPFMGSGTTGVSCKDLNRSFIGIEISPEYYKKAELRIIHTLGGNSLRDLVKKDTKEEK